MPTVPSISTLTRANWTQHRKVVGTPVVADSTDLALINRKSPIKTDGVVSIKGYVRFTGGASPTVDLIPLLYDKDSDSFVALAKLSGVADGVAFQIDVHELPVFFRIDAVANAPTAAEIRLAPAELSAHA